MKSRKILSVISFIVGFILTYLILCFFVPGLRIKLSAPPLEYFIKSIKNTVLLKTIISAIVGGIFASIPYLKK